MVDQFGAMLPQNDDSQVRGVNMRINLTSQATDILPAEIGMFNLYWGTTVMAVIFFMANLFLLCLMQLPASAKQLSGYVEHTELIHASAERPPWIPLSATTNERMVAVYSIHFPRHIVEPISVSGRVMSLSGSIAQNWTGYFGRVCIVRCEPIEGRPGNFYFSTIADPKGPRGWLQDIGKSDRGWLYRYWLDTEEPPNRVVIIEHNLQ